MKYEHVILGDMVTFQKGFVFKSKDFTNYGIPVVKVSNFIGDTVDMSSCEMLPNSFYETNKKYSLEEDEILIATVGSWPTNPNSVVGRVVRVPKLKKVALLNQNIVKITSNPDLLNNDFLYYLLKSKTFKDYLVSTAQGSANQASITLESIKKFNFELPPIDSQYKIAHFLKMIDKKIKTNKQIINSLEPLSQTLFKHWFIDFEFPNEQGESYKSSGGEMVESELGEIPKGWKAGCIGEICEQVKDKVNLDKVNEIFNYIGLEHMPQGSIALANWESSEKVSGNKGLFKKDDILFGKLRPYFKKVGIASINGVCSTDILIFNSKQSFEKSYLLLNLIQDRFIEYATNTATGTRMPRSGWKQISGYKIVIPDKITLSKFEEIVSPMLTKIQDITHENLYLEQLRDTLLPKLLSGEIKVPDEVVVD